ncbi:flocculation protein FLO11 [Copidosoma floridanum]|uniref:flocculation protein FLO11 n=1 Tax=Copidosoma floridanum TaxID=29053 RepID=UPI000C6FC8DC|nr:flocculation protein FLO11 [Copidosoma floridanum]
MEVISTRRYEARPQADSHASILVDPADAVATVKEEEWETRKKKEITTTRQIETRVKRQVVLEDGEVVVDSGPLVTTNTTEDVEQQEHTTQERRTTGDEPQKVDWSAGAAAGSLVQKELNETIVKSREEIEELLETEDRQQLGDISDEVSASRFGSDAIPTTPSTAAAAAAAAAQSRKDALTRKPLDLEEEDEARKFETSKWLESHFGSESRSSHGSLDDEPLAATTSTTTKHNGTTTTSSYINVTMKSSCGPREPHQTYGNTRQTRNNTTTSSKRESSSPSGYFQGISEWSERYQSTTVEKQNTQHHVSRARSPMQQQYVAESTSRNNENIISSSRLNGHHSPIERNNSKETSSYSRSYEATKHRHHERYSPSHERSRNEPPSPPVRRKPAGSGRVERELQSKTERSSYLNHHQQTDSGSHQPVAERTSSPVHVITRTWENRNRDAQQQHEERRSRNNERVTESRHHYHHESSSASRGRHRSPERTRHRPQSPVSRSVSPSPVRRDKRDEHHSRPSKSPSPSKYNIGESFKKLVRKLRSASSERRGARRPAGSSTSQLTQTDHEGSSTYLQYNTVDRNVPLGPDYDNNQEDNWPPERPPRSPRNVTTSVSINVNSTPALPVAAKPLATSIGHRDHNGNSKYRLQGRSGSPSRLHEQMFKETTTTTTNKTHESQPIHRYYLGEDPYGGSIYGKEKGYRETTAKLRSSSRHRARPIEEEYSPEPGSLGRFSKSTSRLVSHEYSNELHHSEPKRHTSAQTLPRKIPSPTQHRNNGSSQTSTGTRRHLHQTNGHSVSRYTNGFGNDNSATSITRDANSGNQYGSMINISFKNTVTSTPKTTHYVQTTTPINNNNNHSSSPPKPERTYKSTLSRSKSFNVEIADDGVVTTPVRTNGYNGSNVRSVSHINKLDEAPPLKSPGILASISRSNRDLMATRNTRLHDY